MRRLTRGAAWGLCLALAFGGARAFAGEAKESCGGFGTPVEFMSSPSEAAKWAKKEGKLVFVLHVSGNFEDPRFT